jgi:hypothetical protein
MWITCNQIAAGIVDQKDEDSRSCPTGHYELHQMIADFYRKEREAEDELAYHLGGVSTQDDTEDMTSAMGGLSVDSNMDPNPGQDWPQSTSSPLDYGHSSPPVLGACDEYFSDHGLAEAQAPVHKGKEVKSRHRHSKSDKSSVRAAEPHKSSSKKSKGHGENDQNEYVNMVPNPWPEQEFPEAANDEEDFSYGQASPYNYNSDIYQTQDMDSGYQEPLGSPHADEHSTTSRKKKQKFRSGK